MSLRLRSLGLVMMSLAVGLSLSAAWMWFSSNAAWQSHLTKNFVAGVSLYEFLRSGSALVDGLGAQPLNPEQADLAEHGAFTRLQGNPVPAYVTHVALAQGGPDPTLSTSLNLAIISDRLRYSLAELDASGGGSGAAKVGQVTRLIATYCSQAKVIARFGDGAWWQIDGTQLWGCKAGPADLRLWAVLLGALCLAVCSTLIVETSSHFDTFARALRNRRRLGGPDSYSTSGPQELREIVEAVNSYLEAERDQLHKRAIVLSGVSHDLGTPATRLRLRTALIGDTELREKLEHDIDRMTGMIDSVLTYTRAELNAEEPRQISLTALVESLVADYQDMGKPVDLTTTGGAWVEAGRSVFAAQAGHATMPDRQRILVVARPISLQRAISNLIDNALKYGRRARVEIRATADRAVIRVQDEGSGMSVEDIEAVIAPFKRGDNTTAVDGFGLGLTIVAAVAEQHGGQLSFEASKPGLVACLEISRQ